MEFLEFLAQFRNPVLDAFMLFVTRFGEETVFMLLSMFVLWCVDKYEGYYILFVGFLGTQINQLLKVTFRVDRPWVKNPNFKAVEKAIPEATGYSFPSGHTQSSVGTFLSLARWNNKLWLRIIAVALCVLVPFSRMYLGVHTLADVSVSLVIAVLLVFALYPIIKKFGQNPKGMRILFAVMLLWSIGQVLFMELYPFPTTADTEQLFSGLKNAYKMLGAVMGVMVAFELDIRYVKFETRAVWWAQIIKLVFGIAFTLLLKVVCYEIFDFISSAASRAFSYFFMVIFAGGIWPMTFKYFAKLGCKKE